MTERVGTPIGCAICGNETGLRQEWFLLTENRWLDRVKIMQWSDALAWQEGVLAVCCAEHARELVAHWMATGALDHPFAQVPSQLTPPTVQSEREPDTRSARVLGELAVHRDSLTRALAENPYAFSGMLEALMSGLGKKRAQPVRVLEEAEELAVC